MPSSADSRVVFPEPVPPVTRKASRRTNDRADQRAALAGQRAQLGELVEAGSTGAGRAGRGRCRCPTPAPGRRADGCRRAARRPPTAPRHRGVAPPGRPVGRRACRTASSSSNRTGVFQPGAAVDPDLLRAVDQHVGHPGCAEQRLERSGPGEFVDGVADGDQHVVVAQQSLGLLPDEGGDAGFGSARRAPAPAGPAPGPAARGQSRRPRQRVQGGQDLPGQTAQRGPGGDRRRLTPPAPGTALRSRQFGEDRSPPRSRRARCGEAAAHGSDTAGPPTTWTPGPPRASRAAVAASQPKGRRAGQGRHRPARSGPRHSTVGQADDHRQPPHGPPRRRRPRFVRQRGLR